MTTKQSLSLRATRWTFAAIAATLLVSALTPTAGAHHQSGSPRTSWTVGFRLGSPTVRYHRKQYDQGYAAGHRAGWQDGYQAGLSGRPYKPALPRRLKGCSRRYLNGYRDGYTKAYRDGYYKGQRERWRRCLLRY